MKRGARFVVPRFTGPGVSQPQGSLTAGTPAVDKENVAADHQQQASGAQVPGQASAKTQGIPGGQAKQGKAGSAPQQQPFAKPGFRPPTQSSGLKPAAAKAGPSAARSTAAGGGGDAADATQFFSVLYIKKESFVKKKVAKSYTDGILSLGPTGAALHALDTGKVVSSGKASRVTTKQLMGGVAAKPAKSKNKKRGGDDDDEDSNDDDEDNVMYQLGTFVVEVQQPIPADSFKSGACFTPAPTVYGSCATIATSLPGLSRPAGFKPVVKPKPGSNLQAGQTGDGASSSAAPAAAGKQQGGLKGLYDPHQPGAVVLNAAAWQATVSKVVPVVVDPYLGRHLRPHQVEGVKFMYECVMGVTEAGHTGCVLADEMGLGKTLQVLALCWTLLKQGPAGRPVANKVIVVTPATLCGNWHNEVNKWLGRERLQVFVLGQQQDAKTRVQQFKHGAVEKLCITSYETLRKHAADLAGVFDLLVCDEGHRLKAVGGSKTLEALNQLACPRRVLLTGTPIQNNLEEFYALVSFVAPDLLGTPSAFRRVYAEPIAKAQERGAAADVQELGASRAAELNRKVSGVLLRRTQAILTKHLPPLINYVLFCKPTDLQVTVYEHIIKRVVRGMTPGGGSNVKGGGGGGGQDEPLAAMTALRKVCNHPGLLTCQDPGDDEQAQEVRPSAAEASRARAAAAVAKAGGGSAAAGGGAAAAATTQSVGDWAPKGVALNHDNPDASGKMCVLGLLLTHILGAGERVVVVSTSTATLDAVDKLCTAPSGWRTVRIDGSTSVDERQSIVDNFNTRGIGQVFLLSTRAGGAGLNLVGANHLMLFDSDWNPAADQQAMARIWRDGQKRPCSVWRLLTTGTIEEKIYQRQIMKGNLATATIAKGDGGGSKSSRQFTTDELRALFVFSPRNNNSTCETKDLLARAAEQTHLKWLDETCVGLAGMPVMLAAVLGSGHVSAASAAVKAEEVNAGDDDSHDAAAPPGEQRVAGNGAGGGVSGNGGGSLHMARSAQEQQEAEQQEEREQAGIMMDSDGSGGRQQVDNAAVGDLSHGSSSSSLRSSPTSTSDHSDGPTRSSNPPGVRQRVQAAQGRGGVQGVGTLDRGVGGSVAVGVKRSRKALLASDSDDDVELPDICVSSSSGSLSLLAGVCFTDAREV